MPALVGTYLATLRLGREGYRLVHGVCREVAGAIAEKLAEMGPFELITDGSQLPVVAFRVKAGGAVSPVVWLNSPDPWWVQGDAGQTGVVTLGNFATRLLLDTDRGITTLRGSSYPMGDATLVPTFHPAAALRGGGVVLAQMRADFVRAKHLMGGAA